MAAPALRGLLRGLCVLAGTLQLVHCERHSLTYIYTALSKPVENPGIHEFTAMGLLDTKMIDYFDSDHQEKVPKQPWMKEHLPADYWAKGTESRKSKQQWFKVNLEILKERMRQNNSDVHVLQWMHGCEADLLPDGQLQFERGIDMYSYDGNNFLYFDDAHEVWVAGGEEAKPTKRKWDEVQVLKDYTKGYLKNECVEWLGKFINYGKQQLKHAAPPDVYMFASPSKDIDSVLLTCMATGFYPPDIVLTLKRGGRVLTEEDGVMTTGVRPNQDDTYQRRDSILILRSDEGEYSCEVVHAASGVRVNKQWRGLFPDPPKDDGFPLGAVLGSVIPLLVLGAAIIIGVVLYNKCCNGQEYDGVSTVSGGMDDDPELAIKVAPDGVPKVVPDGNGLKSNDNKPTEGSDTDSGKGGSDSDSAGKGSSSSDSGSDENIAKKTSDAPPDLYMFASPSKDAHSVLLTCMATGFYPPDIVLTLKRGDRALTEEDGVMTTGVRPNQDDTYQRRDSIMILRSDEGEYSCEVVHAASGVRINKQWHGVFPDHPDEDEGGFPKGAVLGAVIALLVLGAAIIIGVVLYKKRPWERRRYDGVSTVSGGMDKPALRAAPDVVLEVIPNGVPKVVPNGVPNGNGLNSNDNKPTGGSGSSNSLDKKPTEGSDGDSGKGGSDSGSSSAENIQRKDSDDPGAAEPLLNNGAAANV